MTRRKLAVFTASAILLSLVTTLGGLLAADLYLHHRAERSAGLNRWGYRGPILGSKRAGEVRVAVLGGSTVFGYGGPWDEAFPALLEKQLTERRPDRSWRGINLGFNNEGVFAALPTLEDFDYLDIDVVCLYQGYNDMMGDSGRNLAVFRHESPVFRLTGYMPILPMMLKEKAYLLRSGGQLEAAYLAAGPGKAPKPVFRPNLATRTSAGALEAALAVSDSFSRQMGRIANEPPPRELAPSQSGCHSPWVHYCDSTFRAVRYALDHRQRVLVVSQPRAADEDPRKVQDSQREALATMMARQFAGNPRVAYVDLSDAVDLSDRNYSFDKMHLGLDGNRVIAQALVEPVLQIVDQP